MNATSQLLHSISISPLHVVINENSILSLPVQVSYLASSGFPAMLTGPQLKEVVHQTTRQME